MEFAVTLDHPYSRHWSESYKTNTSHAKPIHWLLAACRRNGHPKNIISRQRFTTVHNINLNSDGSEDEIDVESLDEVMSPYTPGRTYDVQHARLHMNETERFTTQLLSLGKHSSLDSRSEENWEMTISKSSWSAMQAKVYSKVLKVLEDEKLARLAYKGINNEPVARRLSLDRATSCLRRILAEFSWDQKLTQWLHSLLMNKLPPGMLSCYLDLIQTLRSKLPALVERMIMQSSTDSSMMGTNTLQILLKKPWEPALVKYPLAPKQRFYEKPVMLIIPNSPFAPSPTMSHRRKFWSSHLAQLGKVKDISSPVKTPDMTVLSYVEQLAAAVRSKIENTRNKYPTRPIVLLGWHTASLLGCHISLVENVSAVICLGFPTRTMNGPRCSVDDILCDMSTPTLFIVGEDADSCDIDKIEDFREQLLTRCETYLLAVPGADDSLRVNERLKKRALVTQHMVDRMALDYVSKFFSEVLIKSVRNWQVEESINYKGGHMSYSQKRRRKSSDDFEISMSKRRRLSLAASARISEVLSGQSLRRGKEGSRTSVHGVSYNLQTGSLSGMATVPNVLSRSQSLLNDQMNSSKSKGRNKNQARSITIDLAKDTASQLKRAKSFGPLPDSSVLATGSQTEAAVATILANDFPTAEPLPPPVSITEDRHMLKSDALPHAKSDSYTRVSDGAAITSSSSSFTSQTLTSYANPTARHPAYSNVKFNSTVVTGTESAPFSQSDATSFSTINKQDWAGIFDTATKSTSAVSDFPRKYPYLPPVAPEKTTQLSSRSRKEERETMQATAILEKLTSGIDNDTEQNDQPGATRGAISYRRRTADSGAFITASRGRGRVRTRGGSMSTAGLARDAIAKRRKTTAVEPTSQFYQQPKAQQQVLQTKPNTVTRYVVSSGVGTMLTNSSTKIFQSTNTATPIATLRSVTQVSKASPKPTILPVYSFTPPATTTGGKIQRSFASTSSSKGAFTVVQSKGVAQQVLTKKPAKVIVGQRLPVKFPGAVPGSSYTFVTIPALTGPPLPATGTRKVAIHPARPRKEPVKYSVVARPAAVVTKAPVSVSTITPVTHVQNVAVSIRGKALPPKTVMKPINVVSSANVATVSTPVSSAPIITSSSVVLHKLWKQTVDEMGSDALNTLTGEKKNT